MLVMASSMRLMPSSHVPPFCGDGDGDASGSGDGEGKHWANLAHSLLQYAGALSQLSSGRVTQYKNGRQSLMHKLGTARPQEPMYVDPGDGDADGNGEGIGTAGDGSGDRTSAAGSGSAEGDGSTDTRGSTGDGGGGAGGGADGQADGGADGQADGGGTGANDGGGSATPAAQQWYPSQPTVPKPHPYTSTWNPTRQQAPAAPQYEHGPAAMQAFQHDSPSFATLVAAAGLAGGVSGGGGATTTDVVTS